MLKKKCSLFFQTFIFPQQRVTRLLIRLNSVSTRTHSVKNGRAWLWCVSTGGTIGWSRAGGAKYDEMVLLADCSQENRRRASAPGRLTVRLSLPFSPYPLLQQASKITLSGKTLVTHDNTSTLICWQTKQHLVCCNFQKYLWSGSEIIVKDTRLQDGDADTCARRVAGN